MEAPDEPQVNYDSREVLQPVEPAESKTSSTEPYQAKGGRARAATAARSGAGRFRTRAEDIARDAEAARLYDLGWTYARVAAELGFATQQRAFDAVKRHIARLPSIDAETIRRQSAERMQDLRRRALEVADRTHIAHSNGRVIQIEDPNQPGNYIDVLDDGPKLQAIDRLHRIEERMAKLYGADAPSKTEFSGDVSVGVELIGVDPNDV